MAFADRLQRERGKAKIDRLVVLVIERRQRALQASFPSLSLSPSLLSLGRGPVRLSLPSCAGYVSKAQAFDFYFVWTNLSLSLSSLSNSSQKCPKLSNSTLQKNLKKTLFPADPQVHGPRRGHEALCAHLGALLRQGALGKGPVGEWRGSGMKSH